MKKQTPLRIGFDLDGVVLYNPARIIRPLVSKLKDIGLIKRKQLQFYQPKSPLEQKIWWLFHQSSIMVAPGLNELEELVRSGKVEAYLITGRFAHLKPDFLKWMDSIHSEKYFKQCFINEHNEQPHLFKKRMIEELQLDYFVEDNWDIVQFLAKQTVFSKPVQICWIYNFFDRAIPYSPKFPSLREAVRSVARKVIPTKKPSVLLVTDYFYPHWTGISQSMWHSVQSIQDLFAITVLTIRFKSELSPTETLGQIQIIRENFFLKFSRTFLSWRLIGRFIREAPRFDVIVINSPFTHIFPVSLIAWFLGKKTVIFHQGDLILPGGFFNWCLEKTFDSLTVFACLLATTVSTYTQDYALHSRILRKFLPKFTPVLLPHPFAQALPVPTEKTNTRQLFQELRQQHQILIGFAGRFVQEKGFDILFRAIPEVMAIDPSLHFVFAGETNMQYEDFFAKNQELLDSVKKHVSFLGLLSGSELVEFYQGIDIFVLPSRSECFGLVQAEAMLMKKPVVVSNIPGARDAVNQTGFGVLFESENPTDLASKIVLAVKNRQDLQSKYMQVEKYFSYQKSVKELQMLLSP